MGVAVESHQQPALGRCIAHGVQMLLSSQLHGIASMFCHCNEGDSRPSDDHVMAIHLYHASVILRLDSALLLV